MSRRHTGRSDQVEDLRTGGRGEVRPVFDDFRQIRGEVDPLAIDRTYSCTTVFRKCCSSPRNTGLFRVLSGVLSFSVVAHLSGQSLRSARMGSTRAARMAG